MSYRQELYDRLGLCANCSHMMYIFKDNGMDHIYYCSNHSKPIEITAKVTYCLGYDEPCVI